MNVLKTSMLVNKIASILQAAMNVIVVLAMLAMEELVQVGTLQYMYMQLYFHGGCSIITVEYIC